MVIKKKKLFIQLFCVLRYDLYFDMNNNFSNNKKKRTNTLTHVLNKRYNNALVLKNNNIFIRVGHVR